MSLQLVPIRSSLNRQLGIAGGERLLVLCGLLISVYFGFVNTMGHGIFIGLIVGVGLYSAIMFVLTRMGSEDMQMSAVFMRHLRYCSFYSAHGRLDAEPVQVKDFAK